MPLPRVAIVGRPNVGKSSLMNMIAGAKVSIVDPTAGTTRDRVTAIVDLVGPTNAHPVKTAEFVDTGGFGVYVEQGARFDEVGADLAKLTDSIEFQISQAVGDADLILFCVDAQQGVTAADRDIARLLRERRLGPRGSRSADTPSRAPAPIRVVATKVDGPKWEAHAPDLANLGFGEPIAVSSKTNYFRRDFLEAVYDLLPETAALEPEAPADLKIAIVGKRNSGKSTLVNTLAGQERVIVSEIAGTTRDAVDVRFELDGRSVVAIDTAGLRRKRSFQNMIEHYAFDRLQRSIDRADVVLLLLDATEKVSQVDEQLAQLIQRAYKPAIICVNKWDLVEGARDDKGRLITPETYEKYLRAELGGLTIAPISFMSASSGVNAAETIDLAFDLKTQTTQRVTTGVLNRIIRGIVDRQGPSDTKGTRAKVYYVAQTGVEPPTITLVVNHPQLFRPQYLRFLMNRLREELPFTEVPIRLVVRARRQREDDLATAGEDGPARVTRGRKGEDIRARRERAKTVSTSPESPEGDDSLLDDANSEAVDVDAFDDLPDNAAEYFDDR